MGARSSHITQVHMNHMSSINTMNINLPSVIDIPNFDLELPLQNVASNNHDSFSYSNHNNDNTLPIQEIHNQTLQELIDEMNKDRFSMINACEINENVSSNNISTTTSSYNQTWLNNELQSIDTDSNEDQSINTYGSNESKYEYQPLLGCIFNTDTGPGDSELKPPSCNTFDTTSHTTSFCHYCQLLDLCQQMGTSLEGFELILKWAQCAYNSKFDFNANHPSRERLIGQLKTIVGLQPPHQPVIIPLEHPIGAKEED